MGKIIGIAMVGFTQFAIWVGLTTVIAIAGIAYFVGSGAYDAEALAEQAQMTTEMQEQLAQSGANVPNADAAEFLAKTTTDDCLVVKFAKPKLADYAEVWSNFILRLSPLSVRRS